MLATASDLYRNQQRLTVSAVAQARKGGDLARTLARYQLASVSIALAAVPDMLAEQGISSEQSASVVPQSLLTGSSVTELAAKTATSAAFDRLVASLVQDAGRTALSVDMATRPAVTGYVRIVNPPCCSRCAILAGRVYRYSQGFRRHPGCDCTMAPTSVTAPADVPSPRSLFESGQIRGVSKADAAAVEDGADLGQVVNVGRREAGLTIGSSVIERAGRPTPAGIYRLASDRAEALSLFSRFGYIT